MAADRRATVDGILAANSALSSESADAALAVVASSNFRAVLVYDDEGWAVTADDLVVGRFSEAIEHVDRDGRMAKVFGATEEEDGAIVLDSTRLWPGNALPYDAPPDPDLQDLVDKARKRWNDRARQWLELRPRTAQDRFFVRFVEGPLNRSNVGNLRIKGGQPLQFSAGTPVRKVIHEIGHAAGLLHEHNRFDRDSYISLEVNAIPKSERPKFEAYPKDLAFNSAYDLDSVMHYWPSDGWGLGDILELTPYGVTYYEGIYGQGMRPFRWATLSDGDLESLKALYGP